MDKKKKFMQRDANKIIKVLFKISEAVNHTRDLNELYKVIHKNLGEIINVDNFYIALYHAEKDSISFPYYVDENGDDHEEIFNLSKTSSLTNQVIKAKAAKIFLKQETLRLASNQNREPLGIVSEIWLGAPLIINNRVKGAVVIQDYESPTSYGKEDLNLLNSVSQHIALAIEQKESKEKLAEQRKMLTQIIESSPVGICLVENRIIKWANNEMHKIFGYEKKEDFENCDVQMICKSETDYKNVVKIISHDLEESGKADFDFELKKKDNTIFNAQVIITGFGSESSVESIIMIIADISQRELAKEELYEKERLQGVLEMAGAVCHEINQPLQAIIGYSELLMLSSKSDDLRDNKLSSIKSQAVKLGTITKKLSNIAHYRTLDYPGDTKIVDIWRASSDAEC